MSDLQIGPCGDELIVGYPNGENKAYTCETEQVMHEIIQLIADLLIERSTQVREMPDG